MKDRYGAFWALFSPRRRAVFRLPRSGQGLRKRTRRLLGLDSAGGASEHFRGACARKARIRDSGKGPVRAGIECPEASGIGFRRLGLFRGRIAETSGLRFADRVVPRETGRSPGLSGTGRAGVLGLLRRYAPSRVPGRVLLRSRGRAFPSCFPPACGSSCRFVFVFKLSPYPLLTNEGDDGFNYAAFAVLSEGCRPQHQDLRRLV